jgi:hypothetical protein
MYFFVRNSRKIVKKMNTNASSSIWKLSVEKYVLFWQKESRFKMPFSAAQ